MVQGIIIPASDSDPLVGTERKSGRFSSWVVSPSGVVPNVVLGGWNLWDELILVRKTPGWIAIHPAKALLD